MLRLLCMGNWYFFFLDFNPDLTVKVIIGQHYLFIWLYLGVLTGPTAIFMGLIPCLLRLANSKLLQFFPVAAVSHHTAPLYTDWSPPDGGWWQRMNENSKLAKIQKPRKKSMSEARCEGQKNANFACECECEKIRPITNWHLNFSDFDAIWCRGLLKLLKLLL